MSRGSRHVFLAVVFMIALGAGVRASDEKDPKGLFSDAVKAYHAARYNEAVFLNEEVLAKGFFSAALYYNLANAYFKSGRLGKAVVNYKRAMRLTPRDSDLRANLSFARSMVENYTPWPRGSAFALPQRFLSAPELQWTAFGIFALAGAVLLAGLFAGLPRKRIVFGTGFLAVIAGYLIGAAVWQGVNRSGEAVCVERAEARFEPNPQATTHFKVSEGAEVRVLRDKEGWYKVERSDGKLGWVPVAVVEKI